MCGHAYLAFCREGFPGFGHRQKLQALIFVLGMMGKHLALAGMPPKSGRLMKGMISITEPYVSSPAAEDDDIPATPQIVGHAAPPILQRE
jgi:hypothetical protein